MQQVSGPALQRHSPIPELLETAARIYRERAVDFYAVAAIAFLVSWTVNLVIKVWTIGGMPLGALEDPRAPEFFRTIGQVFGAGVANGMVYALLNSVAGAIITVMVAARLDGKVLSLSDGILAAAGRFAPVLGATMLYFLAMAALVGIAVSVLAAVGLVTGLSGGVVALALGILAALAALGAMLAFGLYLSLRWALYPQVAVLEAVGPFEALRRGAAITRDRPGTRLTERYLFRAALLLFALVVLQVVMGTIGAVPEYGAGLLFGSSERSDVSIINPTGTPLYLLIPLEILSVLLSAVIFPYGVTAFTLLYFDVRGSRPVSAGPVV